MSDAVPDADAISFSGAFYETLGYGEDVKAAFDLGRIAITTERRSRESPPEADFETDDDVDSAKIPQLLVRAGVDASAIRFTDRR
jgi:hypothetical protein